MEKATGNYSIILPKKITMATRNTNMAPSPRQTLNGQGVLRIPGRKTKNSIKFINKQVKIATWNTRSLFESGKLSNACQEMDRLKLNILGISEVRWPNSGKTHIKDKTFYYSGNSDKDHYNGVGVLLNNDLNAAVVNFVPFSDRCLLLQLSGTPFNVNIIQIYAPTADKSIQELENWYKSLDSLLKTTKKNDINIIMGDFNAKIGKGSVLDIVGNFGLGERNERGDRLVEFCQNYEMIVTNTYFKLPPRRLYTWTSPQHTKQKIVRNQIDFILINKRFRRSITSAKTFPGADINSDHNPVVATLQVKLKVLKKTKRNPKPDIRSLQNTVTKETTTKELNTRLSGVNRQHFNNVEDSWKDIKEIINAVTMDTIPKTSREPKKEWMTEDILKKMDQRRLLKGQNQTEYKKLNKEIRQDIKMAKENWMSRKCDEIEELDKKHDSFNLHRKLKELTFNKNPTTSHSMVNSEGKLITNTEEKITMWETYIKRLFDDMERDCSLPESCIEGPEILRSEVENAIKLLKSNKSPGSDQIYPEVLKLINEENIDLFVILFNKIYDTGRIPQDWLESIFVPLPKKTNPRTCHDFRLISLMSHALKVLLKIIHNRIFKKCEANVSNDQFGFRAGMGTREAIFTLQMLLQKCYDQRKDIFVCFIDLEKAFDTINHTKLIQLIQNTGLDDKDIRLIKNLYWHQSARIKVENTFSGKISIHRGVRQGCVLSPCLFNLYSEAIFKKAFENVEDGIKINGVKISSIRYADDTIIIADSDLGLQRLIDKLNTIITEFDMKINTTKTKIMRISRSQNVTLPITANGLRLEQVNKIQYLGCWINNKLDPEQEIKCRIEQARTTFLRLRGLLCDPHLNLHLRIRLLKCYVWSVLLYGAESWTLTTSAMNRLEAFEMWNYRRILKIPWTDHATNMAVLQTLNKDRELLHTIKVRKTSYLGHILRNNKYYLPQLVVKGKIEGRRGVGRKKLSWIRNIRNWTGLNYEELIRAAENRELFAIVIANLH